MGRGGVLRRGHGLGLAVRDGAGGDGPGEGGGGVGKGGWETGRCVEELVSGGGTWGERGEAREGGFEEFGR